MTRYLLALLLFCSSTPVFADDCPLDHVRHPAVSPLDDAYMIEAYKASFRGLHGREPSLLPGAGIDDGWYYVRQANHYGLLGDDQCHAGWSGYWESWIDVGHGDLSRAQTPARFLPGAAPPIVVPSFVPPPPAPPPVVIDLSGVQAQLTAIALELREHVRADGDAHASLSQNITDGRNENRSAWDEVKPILVFVSKYVVPVASAIALCVETKKCQ